MMLDLLDLLARNVAEDPAAFVAETERELPHLPAGAAEMWRRVTGRRG
jgi:hypothetical protein